MRYLLAFAFALPLLAEDATPPTVEQLQAQITGKDQQIAQLQRQITEEQRDVFLYRQSFNACLDQTQRPALNSTQQRMMQERPAKPEAAPSK